MKSYSLDQLRPPRGPSGVGLQRSACLYYPNFSVHDELWAKEALLLCNFIATIIPRDVDLLTPLRKRPRRLST